MKSKAIKNILSKVKAGKILSDILVIDAHAHVGNWYAFHVPQKGSLEAMIKEMDYLGINVACISALAAIGSDYGMGNNLVAEALKKHPKRFVGYVVVNPRYPEDVRSELNRCFKELRMNMIKIHCSYHCYPISGSNYNSVWEYAEEYSCPVLIHAQVSDHITQDEIETCGRLASKYSRVNFIIAHGGNINDPVILNKLIQEIKKGDNLCLDLAGSYPYFGIIEKLVDEIGAKKILFGSDMPFIEASGVLGRLLYAKISDEQKEEILGRNMANLLRMTLTLDRQYTTRGS